MLSLQEAVRLISSDKAKERSEGIELYKDIFQNPQTLQDLSEGDDDGRRWLRTMQALFTCVQIDKSAVMKKGLADAAPISIRRLKESAHMVQWTVEKACSYFPHPAFISVFNHLTQSLDDRGYVFEPLAADYLKALRMLLNHRPHMDHLDVEKWTRVTACCFNILLNDSMDRELEDGEAKNLFASDEEDGNTSQRVSRVLDAEVTSCLQILVMAPNAPLIGPSHLCAHVLDRYASFLLDYPLDSTAHLPALQGLNHVLSEMEINESLLLRRFAAKVWPAFLALWSTKSRQLKEQVIISMHILVPLFVQRSEYTEHLSSLQKKLLDEPDQRFALQPLALTSIELCSNLKNSAFQYKTLRARRGLSAADSQAWAAIEMTADCTLSLYNVKEEAALPEPDETGQRPTKKLKQANGNAGDQSISDVVQVLVDRAGRGARGHDGKSLQLWSLQILLFVSLRHMRQEIRNDEWISKALPIITELLSNTDLEIQSWSLLILATLTPSPILQLHCKQIWPTVCRRVMQSGTSRAASHAAEAILISGAVPKRETLHELQSLIDDLESQGLSYGFDSVCGFLSRAVTLMSKDLTAARNKPGEKVLAWLQSTAWSTQDKESRSKTCGEMRDSADVVSLLSAICGFESISPWSRAIMQLPVTPVVIRLRQAAMTEEMKAFVSTCTIPQQGAQGVQSGASKAQSVDGVKRSPKSIEVRSLNYIQKTLKAHLNQMREAISASSIVLDHVSKAVDCAVVALLFDGSLQENRIASQTHLVDLAHELLELSLQSIVQSRWTSADIAFVMTSLKPLLDDDKGARVLSFELIQSPGKLAGIETEVLLDLAREEEADKIHILADKLTSLWRSTRSKTLMLAFQKLYDRVMHATPTEAAKTAREQDDDIWAGIAPKGAQQEALYEISQGPNEESTTRVCISAMLALSLSSKSDLGGSALVKKYIVSSESSVPFLLLSGSLIFEKTSKGELSFIMEELEEVLQTIGDDLLADYKYERTVEAQLVALDFLDGTLSQWSAPSQADDFFLKKALKVCVYFVKQFSKGALLWRVEERLGRFLEHFIKSAMQENSPLREVKSPVLEIETLIKSLLTLNGRPDIRVRWSATTMTARLYEIWAQLGFNTLVLYEHTIPLLSMETDVAEQMATRILVIGNALVASSPARHSALYHLIELALVEDNFHDHLCVVLGLTSKLLGFSSVSDLWLLYVTQITWAIINNGYSLEGLPFRVLGYKNQAEMLQQSFQRIASMLVAIGTDSALESLQTLSSLAGKTQKEASIECIPSLVATDLAVLTHVEDVKEAFNTMANGMVSRLQMKGKEGLPLVKKVMSATLDTIIAGILRLFYEPDLKLFADFLSLQDPNCTLLLESVEGLTDRNIHEPCLPQNSGKTVHRSITVMASQMKETFSGPTVYGVIHQMISLIHRERLVNDQHRHIQGLKLYLCLAQKTIEDNAAVIRLLVHSCAVLVGHVDLVDAIWPLLDWVVDLVKLHIPGLSSSLIVLLRHARHFSRSNHTFIQQVGVRLSERLGRLVLRLKESKQGKIAALETICAWPSGYPLTLNDREYTINISKLSNALQATGSISAAFLQRISRAVQRADADEVTEFCSSTVWMILDRLDKEDIDDEERGQIAATFADLLHYCNGRISSPSSTTSFFNLANRKGALTAISRIDTRSQQPLQPLKSWLTRQLVSMSRSAQLDSAEAAVACVRAICTQDPHFAGSTRMDWDPLDAEELRLITFFPNTARNRKKRSRTELETDEAILKATQHDSWMVWICSLLCDILAERVEGASFGPLSEMVSKQISFAKDSFSIILHIFLRSDLQFKEASRKNTQSLSRHLNAVLRRQETDKEVWKAIIQAIVQLRNDDPTETPLACDQWIQGIDFFVLQRRAAQCHLYATAILFAELEHQYREGDISEVDPETRLLLQYDIYSNIEDPDSFYGIKNSDVRHSLVNRLQHEGQWDRLFDLYAAQNESTSSVKGLATTLHHQGFNRLALQMDEKQTTSYSAAWRMGKWDLPIDRLEAGTSQSLYSALRAIHSEKDESVAKGNLQRAFESEYNGLAMANLEANRAARSNARDLLGLREISLWQAKANVSLSRLSDQFEFDDVERIMSVRLSLLRSQRRSFEASQMGDIPDVAALKIIEKETTTLLSLSQEARRASKLQIAMNSVTQAQQLSQDLTRSSVEEEFASLLWDLGDHATAIESLTNIVRARQADKSNGQQERDDLPLALALSRLGQWRATARSHQPRAIRDECFLPAYTLAVQSASTSMEEKASVFYQYAIFAHLQYQTLMKSPDGENLNAFIRYREEELEQLEVQMKKAPTQKIQRALEKTRKLKDMDSEKLNEFEKSKMRFRKEATKMYAVLLPITNAFDDKAVIRLVSLWFENADDQWVNKDLNAWLKNIPSRKFLPFVHQLSSRLSQRSGATASLPSTQIEANNYFQINVKEVVLRMCMEHPFHSLTPLYALTQADDDREGRIPAPRKSNALLSKASAPRASQGTVPIAQLLRKEAAADIIQRVAASHKQPSRIKEWKRVCDACMQWARFDLAIQMPAVFGAASDDGLPKTKAHLISANFNLSITRLQNLEVPVLTKHLPVDETCHYDEIVSITRYSDRFTTAGGVHLPKITDCIGSDGKTYKQLFKNLDDLRQDAVMQQVFGVLNSLLKTDREAKKRELRVRTYIVIPLGPRYGLLEFVGNTRPLQAPLLATHAKYRRKGDITPREARAQLAENEFKKGSREQRADLFEKVGQSLPPTFRFHFLERHKIPMTLLTNRLNYTRSVATTSIVGHILGLGDRHVSNILLDDLTGEVIHIDFGVAFDQGKLLPIPELVPFRLTRDMVDAMGLHGVEGVYRRCCQETLRVMREGASVIETVLQVFKYDPLYDWTQNPVKVIRAQHDQTSTGDPSSSHNSSTLDATANHRRFLQHQKASPELNGGGKDVAELLAERAIGTVMEKLSTSLSVEYTVNDLMMQARDPANLGSIFSGWQAAL